LYQAAGYEASGIQGNPTPVGYSKTKSIAPGTKRGRKRGRSSSSSKAPNDQDEAPRRQAPSNATARYIDGVIGAEQSTSQHIEGSLSLGHAWDCSSASEEQDGGDMEYIAADQGFITAAAADLLFAAQPLEPDEPVVQRPMVRSIYRTCGAAVEEAEEDEDESSEMLWQPVEDAGTRGHDSSHRGCNSSWGASCTTNHSAEAAERRKAARNTHCPSFVRTGHCVRGSTCAFLHCQHTFEERRPALGRWGNPIRPEELTCPVSHRLDHPLRDTARGLF
jgi:hypothetical protein